MKLNLVAIVVSGATLIISCSHSKLSSNDNDKFQLLIKGYLDTTLNDPQSYEPVSFSKPDTAYYLWEYDDPEGIEYLKIYKEASIARAKARHRRDVEQLGKARPDTMYSLKLEVALLDYELSDMKKHIEEKNKTYVGKVAGYKIRHKFRTKNPLGALMLYQYGFEINKDITEIIDIKEVE